MKVFKNGFFSVSDASKKFSKGDSKKLSLRNWSDLGKALAQVKKRSKKD